MSAARVVSGDHRTGTREDLQPLAALCKAGKLFDVQNWLAAGKPVNLRSSPDERQRGKTPLDVAIDEGFHSLIQVLLEGGATFEKQGWKCPMSRALQMRRFDLVELLIEHGHDAASVDMKEVFNTWDPAIMEHFIEKGAEVEEGNPLAYALCNRIQTALRVYKRYRDRFPSFPEQANIALRHHCKEGNLKWVSLMLWAGADPYAPGTENYADERSHGGGLSALAFAALYRRFEVFKLKQMRLDPHHQGIQQLLCWLCKGEGLPLLKQLLEAGAPPNDQENGGSSTIQHVLNSLDWDVRFRSWNCSPGHRLFDDYEARDRMKAIHLLAKHGGRWMPRENRDMNSARKSLMNLTADYTAEFVWIMAKYRACDRESVEVLLRTPKMKTHVARRQARINELLTSWP